MMNTLSAITTIDQIGYHGRNMKFAMPYSTASTMPTTLAHIMPRSRHTPAAKMIPPRISCVSPRPQGPTAKT